MSSISEECWCAGWLHGTEEFLWNAVTSNRRSWGRGKVTREDVEDLRALARSAGGWVIWRDADSDYAGGNDFVPFNSAEFTDRFGDIPNWAITSGEAEQA